MTDATISRLRSSDSASSELLRQAQAGEAEAWRRLVNLYGPAVYRWCRRWPLSADDVADVFQDTFFTVARSLPQFRRENPEDSLRGWLWTITRSRALDHLRRKQREPSGVGGSDHQQNLLAAAATDGLSDDHAAPPLDALTVHAAEALIRAEFEDRTWQLFSRSVIDGQSAQQIAAEFATTPGAVRQARYRVLKRLRTELDGLM